jgi:hypothetical protein
MEYHNLHKEKVFFMHKFELMQYVVQHSNLSQSKIDQALKILCHTCVDSIW